MTSMLPFPESTPLSQAQHQLLALAAVFQAAQLVHVIATSGSQRLGEVGQHYVDILLEATMNIRAEKNQNTNSLNFFHSLDDLHLGLHTLEQNLIRPYDPQPKQRLPFPIPTPRMRPAKQSLVYAMGLLHLSAKVYKQTDYVHKIEKTQQQIIRQLSFFGHQQNHRYQHVSIISSLAQAYTDTASQLKPRIMVKGSANAFKNPQEVALIRAILFAGLQAAHYWRDLGGRPYQLIFFKRRLLKEIQFFAQQKHLQQSPKNDLNSS